GTSPAMTRRRAVAMSAVLFLHPVVSHHAHGAAAAATEASIAVANGFGAIGAHGMRARGRVSVLRHGLSYLVAIGRRLSPRRARAQQGKSNRNDDPSHSMDSFPSGESPDARYKPTAIGREVGRP